MGIVKLYSARACPFAHRTRLVLSHKNIGFELIEIDLKSKPEWFNSQVSGYGKVPAIEHEGNHIWESAIIDEYLDETFPHPELLPAQPGRRALARMWIDYANTRFAPAWGKLLRAANTSDQQNARRELQYSLQHIENVALPQLPAAGRSSSARRPAWSTSRSTRGSNAGPASSATATSQSPATSSASPSGAKRYAPCPPSRRTKTRPSTTSPATRAW